MAAGKEIRTKIKSVENTRKITKAMEMVAASKMRKAQDRMKAARPYAEKIARVATHLAYAHTEYKHPFVIARDDVKRVGLIVISSDKGLCGGLNTNTFRMMVNQMKQWEAAGIGIDVTAIGNKGLGFVQRLGASVVSQLTGLGDTPHLEKLIGPIKVMLATLETEGPADAREEQPEVVVDLGDRPDRGAGIVARAFLFDGDRRRQPFDGVHVGLAHLFEKLPGIGGQGLDIAPLPFGIDRVEGQRGFARAAQARHDDQLVPRNLDIEILQVVLTRPFDDDGIAHKRRDYTMRQNRNSRPSPDYS